MAGGDRVTSRVRVAASACLVASGLFMCGAGSAIATSSGTLSWTAGTFDVNNLFVGLQFADRLNTATGIVNVASSAVLRVNNVTIGRDAGSQAGTGIGTINIDGGTVVVTIISAVPLLSE